MNINSDITNNDLKNISPSIHNSEKAFSFDETQCNGTDGYNLNIYFPYIDENQKYCLIQTIDINSSCVQNLSVQGIDIKKNGLTSIKINLNALSQFNANNIQQQILLQNLDIIKNAGFQITFKFQNTKILKLNNVVIRNSTLTSEKQVFQIDNITQQIQIEKCEISGNKGGIVFQIFNSQKILISESTFKENTSKDEVGGVFYIKDSNDISINKNQFEQNQNGAKQGGCLFLKRCQNVQLNDNKMYLNQAKTDGGGISFLETTQIDINIIQCEHNEALQGYGGCLSFIMAQNITLKNSVFKGNQAVGGGGIYFSTCINILLSKSEFLNNDITTKGNGNGGGLFITDSNIFNGHKLEFSNNTSKGNGGGMELDLTQNSTLEYCNFKSNKGSKGGGLGFYGSNNVHLSNLIFYSNTASVSGSGIAIQRSNGLIKINEVLLDSNKEAFYGGGIYQAYNQADIQLINSVVKNCSSQTMGGGVLDYATRYSFFQNTIFEDNFCNGAAGAIFSKLIEKELVSNCKFINCKSNNEGGIIQIVVSDGIISIEDSIFETTVENDPENEISVFDLQSAYVNSISIRNCSFNGVGGQNGQGGFYIYNVKNFSIYDTDIKGHFNVNKGGSIYGHIIDQFIISNLTINDSVSQQFGGGIYFKQVKDLQINSLQCLNSVSVDKGGCFFFYDIKNIQISNNSNFNNNNVNSTIVVVGGGGAGYIENSDQLSITNANFYNNSAYFFGGGLLIQNCKDVYINGCKFQQNSAFLNTTLQQNEKHYEYHISQGGGLFYNSGKVNKTYIQITNSEFENNMASSGGGMFILQQQNSTILTKNAENLKFLNNVADLGPAFRYIGQKNIILQEQFKNHLFQNNTGLLEKNDIFFEYYKNERITSNMDANFELCPPGTMLIKPQTNCDDCPSQVECEGGYISLKLKKTYWRSSKQSQKFYYCFEDPKTCQTSAKKGMKEFCANNAL